MCALLTVRAGLAAFAHRSLPSHATSRARVYRISTVHRRPSKNVAAPVCMCVSHDTDDAIELAIARYQHKPQQQQHKQRPSRVPQARACGHFSRALAKRRTISAEATQRRSGDGQRASEGEPNQRGSCVRACVRVSRKTFELAIESRRRRRRRCYCASNFCFFAVARFYSAHSRTLTSSQERSLSPVVAVVALRRGDVHARARTFARRARTQGELVVSRLPTSWLCLGSEWSV